MERKCDWCKHSYTADMRNVKRGWGLCCSKSCAAKKREKRTGAYSKFLRRTHVHDSSPSAFHIAIKEKMYHFAEKTDLINHG